MLGAKPSDPHWYRRGKCADQGLHELFDEDLETGEYPHHDEAVTLCLQCPVKRDCFIAGFKENTGIWGGEIRR